MGFVGPESLVVGISDMKTYACFQFLANTSLVVSLVWLVSRDYRYISVRYHHGIRRLTSDIGKSLLAASRSEILREQTLQRRR